MIKLDDHIGKLIFDWVMGDRTMKPAEIKDLAEFYNSLKLRRDYSGEYFRGLKIRESGFESLAKFGTLKLIKRKTESWSCDLDVARRFSLATIFNGQTTYGLILKRDIPDNKVLFSMSDIYDYYEDAKYEDNIVSDRGIDAIDALEYHMECEVVTKTICTSCSLLSDVREISLLYNDRISNIDALIRILGLEYDFEEIEDDLEDGNTVLNIRKVRNKWKLDIVEPEDFDWDR